MSHLSYRALPLSVCGLLVFAATAFASPEKISGTFVTENGATTKPTGNVTGTFDPVTDQLNYTITYGGLSGPVEAAHFHGPAAIGQDAPVLVPIPGPYHSGMSGMAKVNAATAKALVGGETYVNLHTAVEPMGEARAQITVGE